MPEKNGDSCLEQVISLSDVAVLSGYGERTVQRLTKSGLIKLARDKKGRPLRGRYVIGLTLPALSEHTRDLATGDDPSERAYVEARAQRMTASAEMTQLELRHKRGELLECAHVDFVVTNLLSAVKNHMLSIPSRVMHTLAGKIDPREINMIVRTEVHRALREASEFDMMQLARSGSRNRTRSARKHASNSADGDD